MSPSSPGTPDWWEAIFTARPDPETPAWHLRQVLALLPAEILAYLSERQPRVLFWGGGTTASAHAFREQFPRCEVTGTEWTPSALERARAADPHGCYLLSETGEVPPTSQVAFVLDRLQHFADPLAQLAGLFECREVCIVTVPLEERPLGPFTLSQFRPESLPHQHGTFEAILTREFTDPVRGRMYLAVYASAAFRRTHGRSDRAAQEQDKWDAYYTGLGEAQETPAIQTFGSEFADVLSEFLPAGTAVLEAGCGAGFQSLALAREGRLKVSLMDISPQALDAARRLFARAGLKADTHLGDVFASGEPTHDLVFNAGVLEHYTLEQQAAFLRGMASRTKKFVLVLVPNRLCYWYWLWRVQQSARGNWPFGKECPLADMAAAFRAAGLTFLGRAFLGAAWTEALIRELDGLDSELQQELLTVHQAGFAPLAQRSYLTAFVGCVGHAPSSFPPRWRAGPEGNEIEFAEVTASLADALSLRIASERDLREARTAITQLTHERDVARVALDSFRQSAAYRLAQQLLRLRARVAHLRGWPGRAIRGLTAPFRRLVRLPVGGLRR